MPPPPPGDDPAENCWKLGDEEHSLRGRDHGLPDGTWMTTYPPPPGFDGYQNREWDGFNWYERACTAEEAELLEAHAAAAVAAEDAELAAHAQAERDAWFAKLRSELKGFRAAMIRRTPAQGQVTEQPRLETPPHEARTSSAAMP